MQSSRPAGISRPGVLLFSQRSHGLACKSRKNGINSSPEQKRSHTPKRKRTTRTNISNHAEGSFGVHEFALHQIKFTISQKNRDNLLNPLSMKKQLLKLHNSDGDPIDSNDNWMDNPGMQTILSGVGDTTGVGLVKTNDVDPPVATLAH